MASKPDPLPKQYIIKDLEALRVASDPLRLRLLEILRQKPMTVTQVADILGEKPNRLYYHISKLEEVGLLQLVETRPYRGILEKYYQTVAQHFTLDESLLDVKDKREEIEESWYGLLRAGFEALLKELRQSIRVKLQEIAAGSTEPEPRLVQELWGRLRPEKAEEFREKIVALCREFLAAQEDEANQKYNLTVVFFPLAQPDQESPEEEKGA